MNNGSKTYDVADIQRYLSGGMSNSEMCRMEMAALDDPFLQDALDGYAEAYKNFNANEIHASLKTATELLPQEKQQSKKAFIVPLWQRQIVRYAVAASVVLASGWFIFNLTQRPFTITNSQEGAVDVATNTDSAELPAPPAVTPPKATLKEEQAMAANNHPPLGKTNPANTIKQLPHPQQTVDDAVEKAGNLVQLKETPAPDVVSKTASDTKRLAPNPAQLTLPPAAFNSTPAPKNPPDKALLPENIAGIDKQSEDSRIVRGEVVDADKNPVEQISVQVKGGKTAVVSDELGHFKITLPDSNVTMVASGPGFKPKEFKAGAGNSTLELQLEASDASLSEVVVVGYEARKKRALQALDTADAAPVGGWLSFETYVLKNKKLKRKGKNQTIVVLSFEVNDKGKLDEFDIIQSGGPSFDNEAIRLLKEGPLWKNKTTDATALAKITIVF